VVSKRPAACDDGPALILRHIDGRVVDTWFHDGLPSRTVAPTARRITDASGERDDDSFDHEPIRVYSRWHEALDYAGWCAGLDDPAVIAIALKGQIHSWIETAAESRSVI
jgi:hypothetical protein